MQYTFVQVNENYPKRTYRSNRTLKKLHLNEYAKTLFKIELDVVLFDTDKEDTLLDAIYEHDKGVFVYGDIINSTTILVEVESSTFSHEFVQQYCFDLLTELTAIDVRFAEQENITITYGDAYYGEW